MKTEKHTRLFHECIRKWLEYPVRNMHDIYLEHREHADETAECGGEHHTAELEDFAHMVAHQLKNPLSLIIGCTELLQENSAQDIDGVFDQQLAVIVRQSHRMNSIVNALLLLARADHADIPTDRLDMRHLVKQALQRLALQIETKQAHITGPDTWPVTFGYGPWIEEVWVNYLSNALKYGGDPPYIELGTTSHADGMARFWVADHGPGIAREDQARLFTPFTRLDHRCKDGHGLGLSIVKRIVETLGGQVGIESDVNEGSLFFFTLPAA